MTPRLRIYTASKITEVNFIRSLAQSWTEFDFVARWPTEHVGTLPDTPDFANFFWTQDLEDVARCDVVMVYAPKADEHLRGALVEVGMGIALHKAVLVIGDHPDFGTWQYHPRVRRTTDMAQAKKVLSLLATYGVNHFKV